MIYASEFYGTTAYGYKSPNASNGPPVCTISGVSYINNIASDSKSNVIDPDGGSRSVIVHKPNCGAVIGTISDGYGQPSDASSLNAATGKIALLATSSTTAAAEASRSARSRAAARPT